MSTKPDWHARGGQHRRAGYSRADEYYTLPEVFQALDLDFDLDVCAPPGGVPWIPAARHYSKDDDALAQPWEGRVWMNPPYSDPGPWEERFSEHRHGICLVPITRGSWSIHLWTYADAVALPYTWFNFVGGSIPWPLCFAAYGAECVEALGRVGVVRLRG